MARPMCPERSPGAGQRRGSILSNTFFLALADVAGRFVSLVFFALAARHLGVAQFGVLSFSLAFVSMFSVLSDLGIGTLAIREIARDRSVAHGLVNRGITIRLLASTAVAFIVVAAAALLAYPASTVHVVAICSTTVITGGVLLFYTSVLQGFEHNSYTALARGGQTAVMIAGALLLARHTSTVAGYALVLALASSLAALAVSIVVWWKFAPLSLDLGVRRWLPMLRSAVPFGIASILVAFYYWSGSTILSKIAGEKAVGEFGAAYRLVAGVGFLGASFAGAVYPVISRVFTSEPSRWPGAAGRALSLILDMAIPQAVLGLALAGPVIGVLYGPGYEGSVRVMMALVWWGACATMNSMLSSMLFASDRQRMVTRQAAISVAVSLVLNFLLIPRLGALGAAVALSVAEAAGMVFLLASCYWMPAGGRPTSVTSSLVRALFAASSAALAAAFSARWHPWAAIAIALPAYIMFLVLLGGVRPEDLQTLRAAMRRVNV
ncbi:flippase [candidate division WOR-3 bacterium]|uniref:Flippase n=1 Tax=candidate division WOR-3 bacterium TaxID=2052148 RepID=A0A937XDR1_UNCW3|nr:flippase [candidate division WOR-3 bacterium]